MTAISLLSSASAPGIALLTYFYLKDRRNPEPFGQVLKMFLIGVLVVFPTLVIQRGIIIAAGYNDFWLAFFISGLTEEFIKWFILFYGIYNHPVLDEPYDAIIYSVAVSLGFATLENIIYIWSVSASFPVLIMRALLPVSGHALFGVLMGYYIGKAKFHPKKSKLFIVAALIFPTLWHGLFDYILLTVDAWFAVITVFMVVLWIRGLKKVRKASQLNHFANKSLNERLDGSNSG